MEDETVLIDGKEYVKGSPAARSAQERLDALRNEAFAQARPDLIERNIAVIRDSLALDRIRTDANATALLARDLVYVSAETQRKIYERARMMQFVRPDTSHPRGAESYERRMRDHKGTAKVSHTLAGGSPRADVSVAGELLPYRFVRGSYSYTKDDLERAAFARVPLAQWKREACIEMIGRGLDRIGRIGTVTDPDGDAKLRGFFNNPYVPVITLTNGEWATATPDEILADLQEIESAIIAAGLDEQPDDGYRLTLPTVQEGILRTRKASTSDSSMTIAEFFLRTSRLIKQIGRYGALDAATGLEIAASDGPQGIVTPINQERAGIVWPMPIAYEEQTPEMRGWEWLVEAMARCGGVEFELPMFSAYVENMD